MLEVPQWTRSQRGLGWLSFAIFFLGFVIFMVGYTGNSWYVSPILNKKYPPDEPPANPLDPDSMIAPINFGLFYMCYRGHCKYDLRQDYQIVLLLPQKLGITWAYQNYRTACMSIVTVGAVFSLLVLGCYLLFLSGLRISLIFGYITAGLQIFSAFISLIGVIIFARWFYGDVDESPFGWSFGLTIVGILVFLFNGAALIVITIFVHRHISRIRAATRTRTQSPGCLACFRDCLRAL